MVRLIAIDGSPVSVFANALSVVMRLCGQLLNRASVLSRAACPLFGPSSESDGGNRRALPATHMWKVLFQLSFLICPTLNRTAHLHTLQTLTPRAVGMVGGKNQRESLSAPWSISMPTAHSYAELHSRGCTSSIWGCKMVCLLRFLRFTVKPLGPVSTASMTSETVNLPEFNVNKIKNGPSAKFGCHKKFMAPA